MIKAINAYRDGVKASPTSLFLVRAISSCRGREQRLRPASRSGSQWILHRLVQLKLTPEIIVVYMMFDRSLSVFSMTSLKHLMELFNIRCYVQLDLPVLLNLMVPYCLLYVEHVDATFTPQKPR